MLLAAEVPRRLLERDPFQCSVESGAAPFIRSITIKKPKKTCLIKVGLVQSSSYFDPVQQQCRGLYNCSKYESSKRYAIEVCVLGTPSTCTVVQKFGQLHVHVLTTNQFTPSLPPHCSPLPPSPLPPPPLPPHRSPSPPTTPPSPPHRSLLLHSLLPALPLR